MRSLLVLLAVLFLASGCAGSDVDVVQDPAVATPAPPQQTEVTSASQSSPAATPTPVALQIATSEPTATVVPLADTPTQTLPDCPPEQPTDATVVGVDEWANTRTALSVDADEVQRIDVGTTLATYPWSRRSDTINYSWVVVELPGDRAECAWMAAHLLEIDGVTLDTIMPGINYTLPDGEWLITRNDYSLAATAWRLEGTFATTLGLRVERTSIDEQLAAREQLYIDEDYDYPDVWYDEVVVSSADRAVRPGAFVSPSGDGGINEVWIQVGDLTVIAQTYVYIEDLDEAPVDAMADFVDSVSIDRDVFAAVWGD